LRNGHLLMPGSGSGSDQKDRDPIGSATLVIQ
jgi:hypothetical protein